MAGFTKLFNSILDSTIWQEPNETRILWITMLAMCDARGEIQTSIPGLARRAGITLEECERGLATLSSPDAYSRTKEHDGRRIREVSGGFELLNHGRYRQLLSHEERKEYNRKKQAESRAKQKEAVKEMSNFVNESQQCQHIAEAEYRLQIPEAEIKTGTNKKEQLPPPFSSEQFATAWIGWQKYKSERRQKLTSSTISGTFAKFTKWGEAKSIEAIELSISNGWQGLFEPETKQAGGNHAGTTTMQFSGEEF